MKESLLSSHSIKGNRFTPARQCQQIHSANTIDTRPQRLSTPSSAFHLKAYSNAGLRRVPINSAYSATYRSVMIELVPHAESHPKSVQLNSQPMTELLRDLFGHHNVLHSAHLLVTRDANQSEIHLATVSCKKSSTEPR